MSFNPGSALTPSHDDPLEDSVLIRLTETAPARVASTSALEPAERLSALAVPYSTLRRQAVGDG